MLNRQFYDVYAESFSKSRHMIWPGWLRIADILEEQDRAHIDLLDIAAGNGRFEAFLADRFPGVSWDVVCVDPCDDLISKAQGKLTSVGFGNMTCNSLSIDVLQRVQESVDRQKEEHLVSGCFDLVSCFGFMHHVYSNVMRKNLMRALVSQARSGALIAVSFWRFASDDAFIVKAEEQTKAALESESVKNLLGQEALKSREPGDYLLGWQGSVELPRYCHSFSEDEVTNLADCVANKAQLIERFRCDGRTGEMNEYVLLRAN